MKNKYLSMMIASALLAGSVTAFAAEAEVTQSNGGAQQSALNEYALDDVVITATRTEKREVEVPASVTVINADEIKASGANSALAVLGKVNGIAYKAMGPLGAAMGTMNNDAAIRGVDNGTLILVNGNPISWRGKYNLEAIEAGTIERIEIVKGSGSVLYGSDAAAGVINIITKKKADNYVTVGFGNKGQQRYVLNAGTDDIQVHFNVEKFKRRPDVSQSDVTAENKKTGVTETFGQTTTDVKDIKNGSYGLNWNINKNLSFMYNHTATWATYDREIIAVGPTTGSYSAYKSPSNNTPTVNKMKVGDPFNWREYTVDQDTYQLNYNDGTWKASMYFNDTMTESNGNTYYSNYGVPYKTTDSSYRYNTRERNQSYGIDVQKKWDVGEKTNFVLGADWKHEVYQNLATHTTKNSSSDLDKIKDLDRNIFAVFGQWEQKYDAKNSTILGVRETFTTNAPKSQNYNNLSASIQYLHKMDKDNNMYVSVAQSFIMPTFSQMYGASWQSRPNPDLKPQTGVNYEIGWKNDHNAHSWRAAIFHTDIKDNITASYDTKATPPSYQYVNEKFRNTGFELSCDIDGGKKWNYGYGITVQDPKAKSETKNYWDRKFGRLQLTGGIGYKLNKFKANLSASALAYRVQTPSKEHSFESKPYFLTTLALSYAPTKASEFMLTIDNVLDRHDNTMHSSSSYYSAPFNYMFSFTQHF